MKTKPKSIAALMKDPPKELWLRVKTRLRAGSGGGVVLQGNAPGIVQGNLENVPVQARFGVSHNPLLYM